jgi:hypothetical protein
MAAVVGLLGLAACSRTADVVPMNEAANALGIPKLDMMLYGTGSGPATFSMPDGEVLSGHYLLMVGGAVSTSFETASGPRGTAFTNGLSSVTPLQNPFVLQAAGNRGNTMACEGTAGGLGHGAMTCMTNHGAQYQMMFQSPTPIIMLGLSAERPCAPILTYALEDGLSTSSSRSPLNRSYASGPIPTLGSRELGESAHQIKG